MHRRTFLARCGLAAGTFLLPVGVSSVAPLPVVAATPPAAGQYTAGDRALLRILSAYSSDVYFWGNGVLARATGVQTQGTTDLLVRVADYGQLVAFFRSKPFSKLGMVRVQDDILAFTFQGTAYTVTNASVENFNLAVAGGGVTRGRAVEAGLGVFSSQTLLYHPATDTVSDPNLLLTSRKVDLVKKPTGGIKAQVQTLVEGWKEARRHGLKLGKKFNAFQTELLNSVPTEKAASKVLKTLLGNISELAGMFSVEDLRPLITSPLTSNSLESVFGLEAEDVLDAVEKLRGELAAGDYSDAALWLAALLGPKIKDGTFGDWLDLLTDDTATNAATRAALPAAQRLVELPGYTLR